MEVISIESKAFQELIQRIENIDLYVKSLIQPNIDDVWIDSYKVCTILKISQKTLQRLRDNNRIMFSKINRRTYYSIGEIKRVISQKIITVIDSDKSLKDLLEHHKNYYRKHITKNL